VTTKPDTEEVMLCLSAPKILTHKDWKNITLKLEDFWECRSHLNQEGHSKNKEEWNQYLIRKMKDNREVQFTPEEIVKFREGDLEDFRWHERYFRGGIKGYLQKHNIPYEDNEYSKKIEPLSWPPLNKEELLKKHTAPNSRKRQETAE